MACGKQQQQKMQQREVLLLSLHNIRAQIVFDPTPRPSQFCTLHAVVKRLARQVPGGHGREQDPGGSDRRASSVRLLDLPLRAGDGVDRGCKGGKVGLKEDTGPFVSRQGIVVSFWGKNKTKQKLLI